MLYLYNAYMNKHLFFITALLLSSVILKAQTPQTGVKLDYGKGNYLLVHTAALSDVEKMGSISSIISQVSRHLNRIKDSLPGLHGKTVNVKLYENANASLTVKINTLKEQSYYISITEVSDLKTAKDTLNIFPEIASAHNDNFPLILSFVLNDVTTLMEYDNAYTTEFIQKLINESQSSNPKKIRRQQQGGVVTSVFSVKDNKVTGNPFRYPVSRNQLEMTIGVAAQNYKHYFTPAFSLNLYFVHGIGDDKRGTNAFGISWEPNYLFKTDPEGKLAAYRNDFITLNYRKNFGASSSHNPGYILPVTLGYLIKGRGGFMPQNTFKFGVGGLKYKGLSVQPYMYFNDFFKGVTPAIQLGISM